MSCNENACNGETTLSIEDANGDEIVLDIHSNWSPVIAATYWQPAEGGLEDVWITWTEDGQTVDVTGDVSEAEMEAATEAIYAAADEFCNDDPRY